ncbi:MAG TPA: DUF488 domain-containing protein, partial [Gemmatimonadales bacterium]|nr:DUF488 domain-containing protein [Gemmatimonadales bacterium]
PRIWTVGHSTLPLGQFLELLADHEIEAIADVRRYPGSRRWPHFSRESLAESLAARGIAYEWFPDLGGRREPLPDSPNTAWRSPAFRGYADYMETEPFAQALDRLAGLAGALRTAVMCAEAVWWRCHRGLIADALRWSGYEVGHIMGPGALIAHPYTSAARIENGVLTYRAPAEPDLFHEEMHHVP